jgi:uncharacterized protein YcaQ
MLGATVTSDAAPPDTPAIASDIALAVTPVAPDRNGAALLSTGGATIMKTLQLSKAQARRFLLAHQSLLPPRSLQGKTGIVDFVRKVNCVQFDPIDVTGRNHELVLQARVRDFSTPLLYEALYEERRLVDGFDKNLCIYPMEDWPFFRRIREAYLRDFENRAHPVLEASAAVRQEIEKRGPLCSSDIDLGQNVRWPWGMTRLSRATMEAMYFWGELIVHHKVGVRKYYDLAERHVPPEILSAPEPHPSDGDYLDWRIHRRIGSVGLLANRGVDAWLGIEGTQKHSRSLAISRLTADGRLREVEVEGFEEPLFMRSEDEPTLNLALKERAGEDRAAVLAPLDNLIWDRRLVSDLFGFNYTWEVYTPAAKRRYGYYVLPVLYGDRFVARFEPVRDRKSKTMIVKNWWWEENVERDDGELRLALHECLEAFRTFLRCDAMRVEDAPLKAGLSWLEG